MKRSQRLFLIAGILVPILYFGNLIISSFFYPGYSHVRQYASELGSSQARYPFIFNIGVIFTGIASIGAAFGFYFAILSLAGKRILAIIVLILVALFGVAIVMAGIFPMPDPRHGAFGIGLGIHFVPVLLAAAFWRRPELRTFNIFLIVINVLMLTAFGIMMGIGQLVTRANVGVFQRIYGLTNFLWILIAGYVLYRKSASD